MTSFELRPVGGDSQQAGFTQLIWGLATSVTANVDAWLSSLGPVSPAAVDLVRMAAAAYMADRQTRRPVGYTRSIQLHVQVTDVDRSGAVVGQVVNLLQWLTADLWEMSLGADGLDRPEASLAPGEQPESVALLSGGLDSMAAAVAGADGSRRAFVAHWDNPTVKASQDRVWNWLRDVPGVNADYRQVRIAEAASKQESSTRSRSLLFFALAVALASSSRCDTVEVPENGFTSLNMSLGNNRGGVLSTRSTHPWTIRQVQGIVDALGLGIRVHNPYERLTKGELVALAGVNPEFPQGVPLTLSCGKMDGRWYHAGNPNYNCGLCVACLTRRGSLLSAGLQDETPYLMNTIDEESKPYLLERRSGDVLAVRAAVSEDIDEFALLAQGPYPDDFDLTAAVGLCRRGLAELKRALPQ